MIPLVIAYLSIQVPYIQSQTNRNSGKFFINTLFYLFICTVFLFSVPKNNKRYSLHDTQKNKFK